MTALGFNTLRSQTTLYIEQRMDAKMLPTEHDVSYVRHLLGSLTSAFGH